MTSYKRPTKIRVIKRPKFFKPLVVRRIPRPNKPFLKLFDLVARRYALPIADAIYLLQGKNIDDDSKGWI